MWKNTYEKWKNKVDLDAQLRQQLIEIESDKTELEDCFYKDLAFGTGGIRGILGPGTNRLNIYTIRKSAAGLAQYIASNGADAKARGVVIAYDCRYQSPEFAMEVAKTLGYYGIQSYVFESLRTTPELSFAVRYLQAFAGVMITASHNPPEYNGMKVYGEDGGQVISEMANEIVAGVNEVGNELDVQTAEMDVLKASGLLRIIGKQIDDAYQKEIEKVVINKDVITKMAEKLKIVYSPFHGTGNIPVRTALQKAGFKHVQVVKEQELPDADFSTVDSPNPEEHAAFELAMQYGREMDADILIGTDPDCDRMGVAVKDPNGNYQVLTGNQIGAIMLHYLITQKKQKNQLPENAIVIKTIVTSELGREIANTYGVETFDTLTGFKYIAEKIKEYEKTGEHSFLIGYEESYGYLIQDFVRDKDAVQSCVFISEVAAYYKSKDKTLYDGLLAIFEEYGFYKEGLKSHTLEGKEGAEQISRIITEFRNTPPQSIAGQKVVTFEDYQTRKRQHIIKGKEEEIILPRSNVLKFILEDDGWVCIRPSGTEPKIKFYFGVKGATMDSSQEKLQHLMDDMMAKALQNN